MIVAIVFIILLWKKDKRIYLGSYRVELKNVTYRASKYGKKILDNISFVVEQSEIVAIIGPNAAGKSSILKAICGEININKEGQIWVGSTLVKGPINRCIDSVGIVHQYEDEDLIENLSIYQNIAIRQIIARSHSPKIFSTPSAWITNINSIIARIGIQLPDSDEIIKNLAGGEKQLLNVLLAIHLEHQHNPCGLLLLDEHTSRLSPKNERIVMKFTMEEVKKNHITTIMVTHKYSNALEYADRIFIIKNGKLDPIIKRDNAELWKLDKITEIIEK
jgi:putative tryptophan/tyrosine transport system ATP-binding protein